MSLYEWAQSVPWQIAPDALRLMLDLAQRTAVDEDELRAAMHGPTALALRDGRPREDRRAIVMHGPVARIAIDGPIFRYADYFTKYSGGITTEALAKHFQTAMDDPAVQAILFVIDSPGGEATGINELADAIYAGRQIKPSAAYIEGLGASAALRIGAATGQAIVDADAWLGSIGTVLGITDPTKQVKRTIDFVSSQSPKKRADPSTPEGAAYYQQLVDDMTETFIAKIMRDRKMTRAQILALGGGMVVGQQAVDAGLADRLGSEDQVIRELAAQAAGRVPLLTPPARVPSGNPARFTEGFMNIDWKSMFTGLFAAQAEAEGIPPTAPLEPPTIGRTVQISEAQLAQIERAAAPLAPVQSAQASADRTAELEKQIASIQKERTREQAIAFADRAVREQHALPAEHSQIVALYIQAAEDDAAAPLADSRVGRIEAMITARPAHGLTQELVGAGVTLGTLSGASDPKQITEERQTALLATTPLGQAALARRRARA
jgi:ClpP class serine protease